MSDIDEEEEDEDQEDVQEVVMLHPFVAWLSLHLPSLVVGLSRMGFPFHLLPWGVAAWTT